MTDGKISPASPAELAPSGPPTDPLEREMNRLDQEANIGAAERARSPEANNLLALINQMNQEPKTQTELRVLANESKDEQPKDTSPIFRNEGAPLPGQVTSQKNSEAGAHPSTVGPRNIDNSVIDATDNIVSRSAPPEENSISQQALKKRNEDEARKKASEDAISNVKYGGEGHNWNATQMVSDRKKKQEDPVDTWGKPKGQLLRDPVTGEFIRNQQGTILVNESTTSSPTANTGETIDLAIEAPVQAAANTTEQPATQTAETDEKPKYKLTVKQINGEWVLEPGRDQKINDLVDKIDAVLDRRIPNHDINNPRHQAQSEQIKNQMWLDFVRQNPGSEAYAAVIPDMHRALQAEQNTIQGQQRNEATAKTQAEQQETSQTQTNTLQVEADEQPSRMPNMRVTPESQREAAAAAENNPTETGNEPNQNQEALFKKIAELEKQSEEKDKQIAELTQALAESNNKLSSIIKLIEEYNKGEKTKDLFKKLLLLVGGIAGVGTGMIGAAAAQNRRGAR